MKVLLILEESSWKIETKLFPLCTISHKTRVTLRYFVSYSDIFPNNFEININNYFESNLWFKRDKAWYGSSDIDVITSQFRLQQPISEPTHLVGYSSFCIGLILTSQPDLVMKSRVPLSTMISNCHHRTRYMALWKS